MNQPTKETHRYTGMWRPPFDDVLRSAKAIDKNYLRDGIVILPFGDPYGNNSGLLRLKELWLAGQFDEAQYDERILASDVQAIIERHRYFQNRAASDAVRYAGACVNSTLNAIEDSLFRTPKPPADPWRDPLHAGLTRREIPQ